MSIKYTVITENDESAWDDQTGIVYHFPKRYLKYLQSSTKVLYYKGKLQKAVYRSTRMSDSPHYFGCGVIGNLYPDPNSDKGDWYATITDYEEFSSPVNAKTEDSYYEIPTATNYWRNAVRPINAAIFNAVTNRVTRKKTRLGELELDDVSGSLTSLVEGDQKQRYVTTYERNPDLRRQAIAIHGNSCMGCGFNFHDFYGDHGKDYIHVHHVKPVAESGVREVDPVSELITLCANCHAMVHRRKASTLSLLDLRNLLTRSALVNQDESCPFCTEVTSRAVEENELAIAFLDGYPVTPGHTLIIPKRHVADYFDLHQPELNAINQLLRSRKACLQVEDPSITGFNVGINAGASAGQTVFHCHIHLIPRRDGDMQNPKGGVRGVIPERQKY